MNSSEKEIRLIRYFEENSTIKVLKEVQANHIFSCDNIVRRVNKINLPQPVTNALIYYILTTNNRELVLHQLFKLANLCEKFKIKNAKGAIRFFKQYHSMTMVD